MSVTKKIDTSNWSVAVVDIGNGYSVTDRTLRSEEETRQFCDIHGYRLISFQKGTHPYCK